MTERLGPCSLQGPSLAGAAVALAYLQKPMLLHVPLVGGFGQSAPVWHGFVQIICIMTRAHEV